MKTFIIKNLFKAYIGSLIQKTVFYELIKSWNSQYWKLDELLSMQPSERCNAADCIPCVSMVGSLYAI